MQAPETLSAQHTYAAATPQAQENRARRKHFKTEGENRFNFETYTGVGYALNVAISLAAVYWAERTKSGQALIGAIGKGFGKLGVDAEHTKFIARKTFFLTGGFAVVPVMKWLEDQKVDRVKQYNREFYGARAETDPTIVESERELEESPKQSWASMLSGRALALLPFYLTIGLLWNQTSKLSLFTNPEFAKLGKAGRKALEPEAYAQLASKGHYFDKPITTLSRDIGKLAASRGTYFDTNTMGMGGLEKLYRGALSLVGKPLRLLPENKAAVKQIEQMEKQFPGAMRSVKEGAHDPIHAAAPYYAISEAITSAMVAWGLFVITRVTGPFFDKKPHHAAPVAQRPAAPAEMPPVAQPRQAHMPGLQVTQASGEKLRAQAPAVSL